MNKDDALMLINVLITLFLAVMADQLARLLNACALQLAAHNTTALSMGWLP